LGSRGAGKFLKDRTARLLVPLVVGIFTHAALQVYLERITHGEFRGSFIKFLPHYFDGLYAFGGNFAWMGLHLWYLGVLFVFSLICLPLLFWLKRGSGVRLLHRLGGFLARTGVIYFLALPIVLLFTGVWIRDYISPRASHRRITPTAHPRVRYHKNTREAIILTANEVTA